MRIATSIATSSVAMVTMLVCQSAAAQVNCNSAPHGQARANCYNRESQIYAEQSRNYNSIARDQFRQHQQVGQALRRAPLIGQYAAPAWNAPRYIYQYRNGRP